MKNLKINDAWKSLFSIMLSSIIPAGIGYLIFGFWGEIPVLFSTLISACVAMFAFVLFYGVLPLFKCFRPFKKYEGRWIQIIPGSPRPLSVLNFKYKKFEQQYELSGFNFTENYETGVEFVAHKFVRRDHYAGFYYITNHTWEQKNGLGKIGFISNNIDGLTRAEGYFFDASNDDCSRKYDTIMIKCDKKFFRFVDPTLCDANFDKFPEKTVARMCSEFVKKEIEKYNCLHNISRNIESDCIELEAQEKDRKHVKIEGTLSICEE